MSYQTLLVKRRPVNKGIMRRLSAVTRNRNRKQRVAAATAGTIDDDVDDNGSRIFRALVIIFLIHILAIALIFIHQRFLNGRNHEVVASAGGSEAVATATVTTLRENRPRLAAGDKPYVVKAGDNYSRIAATEGVDETELRAINNHVNIGPGLILKIPPKRIVAVDPPEVVAIRAGGGQAGDVTGVAVKPVGPVAGSAVKPVGPVAGAGLVAVNDEVPPRAQPVRNGRGKEGGGAGVAGKTYVVQPGDSVWRIANRMKVNQEALMKANGITDARKMKTGMKLVIPGT